MRNWSFYFALIAFAVGYALALSHTTTIAYAIIDYEIKANDWLAFIGAILGSGITVIGAILVARLQVDKQERAELLQSQRELNAARSILASDLSDIARYLEQSATVIGAMVTHFINGVIPPVISMPRLEPEIALRLARLVALAPIDVSSQIAEVLKELQIQRSRLTSEVQRFSFPEHGVRRGVIQRPHSLDAALESTFALRIQIDNLFEYARRQIESVDAVSVDEKTFWSAQHSLGLETMTDPEMLDRIRMSLGIPVRNAPALMPL